MKKARRSKRFVALLVDFLISLAIAAIICIPTILALINCLINVTGRQEIIALFVSALVCGGILLLLSILYFTFVPVYFGGQTIGKRLVGIKLIDTRTGKVPEAKVILARETVRVVLVVVTVGISLIIGIICKLLTEDRLTFQDAISHTMVVEIEPDNFIEDIDSKGGKE